MCAGLAFLDQAVHCFVLASCVCLSGSLSSKIRKILKTSLLISTESDEILYDYVWRWTIEVIKFWWHLTLTFDLGVFWNIYAFLIRKLPTGHNFKTTGQILLALICTCSWKLKYAKIKFEDSVHVGRLTANYLWRQQIIEFVGCKCTEWQH